MGVKNLKACEVLFSGGDKRSIDPDDVTRNGHCFSDELRSSYVSQKKPACKTGGTMNDSCSENHQPNLPEVDAIKKAAYVKT